MGVTMAGALGTHIVHGEHNRIPPPLLLLALSAVVFYVRRPDWLARRTAGDEENRNTGMSSPVQSR
jgi:hypothetical protein